MLEGYFGEHLYDINLNLDQWFRRRYCLKKSILALVANLLGGAKLFVQISVEGIMGNIHVKLSM